MQVYMGNLPPPVCSPVVKPGNYAATVGNELSISAMTMDEDVMARWLILNGPLSVALDATGMEYYSEGIDMGEVRQTSCPEAGLLDIHGCSNVLSTDDGSCEALNK